MHCEDTPVVNRLTVIGDLPSPVPKSEGPGAPSVWFGEDIGTGATRRCEEQVSVMNEATDRSEGDIP